MRALEHALLGWVMFASTAVLAQEDSAPGGTLEIPYHRALYQVIENADISAFETDGCSGGMSAIWRATAQQFSKTDKAVQPPWEYCCVRHDKVYHGAGAAKNPEESFLFRWRADQALRSCVRQSGEDDLARLMETSGLSENAVRAAYRGVSDAMYWAVRLGGGPCTGLSWRWGYGYPDCSVFADYVPAQDHNAPME